MDTSFKVHQRTKCSNIRSSCVCRIKDDTLMCIALSHVDIEMLTNKVQDSLFITFLEAPEKIIFRICVPYFYWL